MSLVVIVPTRSRPHLCERLIESFDKTTDDAQLLFVTDGDDDSYDAFDFKGHGQASLSPRGTLVQKLNQTAKNIIDNYDHIMWVGDDHVFITEHWDTLMLAELANMGGSGWVYPNDKRRSDVPESWMVSSDIVRELGYLANPLLAHYYIDNSVAEIGRRAALIRWCKNVIIEHRHYSVDDTAEYDELYQSTERFFGKPDLNAYSQWRQGTQISAEVARLRRKFNPDVKWILGKV